MHWPYKQEILLGVGLGFLFLASALVSAVVTYFFFNPTKTLPTKTPTLSQPSVPSDSAVIYSVVLLGYGGGEHSGGGLADTIQIVRVDVSNRKIALIAVPRDTWVDNKKINAYFIDGAVHAKQKVAKITGLPIDYYLAVDFSNYVAAIDALGGIDVNVSVAFDDRFYPVAGLENELCGKTPEEMVLIHEKYSGFELEKQFECRYEQLHFDAGTAHMDGETALKFVRSRHSETHGGDFARGERAQAVLIGIRNKLLSLGALNKIDDFFSEFGDFVQTDLELSTIKQLVVKYPNISTYSVTRVNLTEDNVLQSAISVDGQYILIPKAGEDKWGEVREFIKKS